MSDDIVERLRRWSHDPHGPAASDLMDHAANEIERLRSELAEEARINGAGSEREARLMAIVAEREREIARLRNAIRKLAEQDATLSVCEGNVTVEITSVPFAAGGVACGGSAEAATATAERLGGSQ